MLRLDPAEPIDHRRADSVFQVYLRDGGETWIIIHLELQTRLSRDLPARLFEYYTRLTVQRNREVVSFVLLTGSPRTRRQVLTYTRGRFGCENRLQVPVLNVAALAERRDELVGSNNRFGPVALAHIAALATAHSDEARLAAKVELTLGLLDAGYSEADAQRLFQFFDWLLRLPDPLTERFIETIQAQEGARPMKLVTSVERISHAKGLEQGLEQGLERGRRDSIADLLRLRFGREAEAIVPDLDKVTNLIALRQLLSVAQTSPNLQTARQAILAAQQSGPEVNGASY